MRVILTLMLLAAFMLLQSCNKANADSANGAQAGAGKHCKS